MPGSGTDRDRPTRGGTFRDAATADPAASDPAASDPAASGPAAVRLREGLDGWRRHIRRRRSAVAARRWSLITLGTALAAVAAGRLDGSMLMTAVIATALPLGAGAVSVVRQRRVSAEDAARDLDAAFGFDEQVATALCCAERGTAIPGGAADHNRLVAELIERAAGLVARPDVAAGPRPVPAYGEWAAMAVTAAAIAAVATVPGSHPAALAAGGPGRAGPLAGAAAARPTHAGGVIPGSTGSPDARVTAKPRTAPTARGASAPGTAAGGTRSRPAASATGSAPTSPAKAGAQTSSGKPGAQTSPGKAGAPASPGTAGAPAAQETAGAPAAGGRSATAPTGGSGQRGPTRAARPAAGQSAAQSPATPSQAAPSQTALSPTTRAAMTQRSVTQSATAQHPAGAPGPRGAAARSGGLPGGDAAGTAPGNDRTSAHPAQPLPSAGGAVLLIVLPGGDGTVATPTGQGAPGQQPAGDGGTATAISTATAQGDSAAYVPPDQNEIPFPDLAVLWRYF